MPSVNPNLKAPQKIDLLHPISYGMEAGDAINKQLRLHFGILYAKNSLKVIIWNENSKSKKKSLVCIDLIGSKLS